MHDVDAPEALETVVWQALEERLNLGHQSTKIINFRNQCLISVIDSILACLAEDFIVDATKLVICMYGRKE